MPRHVKLILTAVILACTFGCAAPEPVSSTPAAESTSPAKEPLVLKIGCQSTESSSEGKVLRCFEELVEAGSEGEIDVQLYLDSALGPVNDLLSGVSLGTIEMATIGLNSFSSLCGDFALYDLWTFKGPEEFVRFYSSAVGQQLNQTLLEQADIRVLSYNLCGPGRLYFWGNQEISTLEDYRGLRIRTNSSSACAVAIAALEAIPVPVSWSDMSVAFQIGIIDVESGDVENMLTSGYCEQVAYRYDTPPNFMGSCLCVSERVWESLSSRRQELLLDAAIQACQEYGVELYQKQVSEDEEVLARMRIEDLSVSQAERDEMEERIDAALREYLDLSVSQELLEQACLVLAPD